MQIKAIILSGFAAFALVQADTTVQVSGSSFAASSTIDLNTLTAAASTAASAAASTTASSPPVATSNAAAAGGFAAHLAGGFMAAGAVGAAMVL